MAFGPNVGITVNAEAYVDSLTSIAKPKLDKIVALALVDTAKSAQSKAASLIAVLCKCRLLAHL